MTASNDGAKDASIKYLKAQKKIVSLKEEKMETRHKQQRVYNSLLDSAVCLLSAASAVRHGNKGKGMGMVRVGIYIKKLARFLSPNYTAGNALGILLDEHNVVAIRQHVNSIEVMTKEALAEYRKGMPSPTLAQIVEQVTVLFGWLVCVNDTSRCMERRLFESHVKEAKYLGADSVKEIDFRGLVVMCSALEKLANERQLEAETKHTQEESLALSTIKTYEADLVLAKHKKAEEISGQTDGWGHW